MRFFFDGKKRKAIRFLLLCTAVPLLFSGCSHSALYYRNHGTFAGCDLGEEYGISLPQGAFLSLSGVSPQVPASETLPNVDVKKLVSVTPKTAVYAELPIETGKAKTASGDYIDAYSHLVDIRKYLKVYESTDPDNTGIDLSRYDVKVSMKLSTSDTTIGKPFYTRNLCMIQYDTLQKLIKAVELFREDGYTVVIYDAYRPTSVQQQWFDVVRVHKWVADPSIGMGGIHDRGTAVDMSLIGEDGIELEMPTPMHTFTDDSARNSENMTETARRNMDYMKDIMVGCGFTYINSEWWHFQDVDTQSYLPTDHPIDDIPMEPSEQID